MQKDLVEALEGGGYYEVHISKENTCYIPGIGKCLVEPGVFAWRIVKILEAKNAK